MLLIRDWSGSESTPAGWRTRHAVPERRGLYEPEGQSLADAQPGETQRIAA